MRNKLDRFMAAYLEAIYFTETGDTDQPSGEARLTVSDRVQVTKDCARFYTDYADLIGANIEQAGHDFWLTRNGHGAGFWDRPEVYGEEQAEELTAAAHAFGEVWPEFEPEAAPCSR